MNIKKEILRLWKGFWKVAAPVSWIASTIPMIVGAVLAYSIEGEFNLYWFMVALIGIYLIETSKNAANKLIDFKLGVDTYKEDDVHNPFTGKSKSAIVTGELTLLETALISLGTLGLAGIIGLYIVIFREVSVLWIGITGVVIAIFYSLPPFKFSYRGLGEISVGIAFGPLVLSGIYLVMTNTWNYYLLIISLPIAFFIANVLIVNEIPDYDEDLAGNKRNLVVRFGQAESVKLYGLVFILGYSSFIIISIVLKNPIWLIGLVGIPVAKKCYNVAGENYNNPEKFMEANGKTILVYAIMGVAMIIASIFTKMPN